MPPSSQSSSDEVLSHHTQHSDPTSPAAHTQTHNTDSASDDDDDDDSSDGESNAQDPQEDDNPVLSRADKRRQKKKGKQISAPDVAPDHKPSGKPAPDASGSSTIKRQNSVWVGNLAFKTTPDLLRKFFDGVGEITRIHMPMKLSTRAGVQDNNNRPPKENRGFAYVDFASVDAKLVAISLSEKPLAGRRLLIKDGDNFDGRPVPAGPSSTGSLDHDGITGNPHLQTKTAQKILRAQKQPPGPTLFLGNLGFEATEESIRNMLESHRVRVRQGNEDQNEEAAAAAASDKWIRKIRMGTFEDSGKCKGWSFVDFTTTEHATAALTNPRNHHLDGRNLVLEYASPDAVRRGGYRQPASGAQSQARERKRTDFPVSRKRTHENDDADAKGKTRARDATAAAEDGDGVDGDGDGDGDVEGGDAGSGRPTKRTKVAGGRPVRKEDVKGPRTRAKPGAALAQAKREAVAIVPSQGQKIVF